MKVTIIIITFLTIAFVLAAVLISAAKNAPDTSIDYTPAESSDYPHFEFVSEETDIWDIMNRMKEANTTTVAETDTSETDSTGTETDSSDTESENEEKTKNENNPKKSKSKSK